MEILLKEYRSQLVIRKLKKNKKENGYCLKFKVNYAHLNAN